jgi:hypothetical protein
VRGPPAVAVKQACTLANDDFAEVQRQLEVTASELKTATDPERRRTLLREMSRLLARLLPREDLFQEKAI